MKIHKAYRFRLYPTKEQEQKLLQHGGNARYLWNYFLNLNKQEYEKKLKKTQRQLSKKKKGSNNRNKQRKKVNKIHRKIRNIRKDFQHKTTFNTITKYDVIIVENLNIQGMMKNHKLAKAIADCGWHEFKRQLKYKSLWNNKIFLEIDRFEPTSKKCSCCGWKNNNLTLGDRTFVCEECGLEIDRDLNSAINIKQMGIDILLDEQEFTLEEINNSLSVNQEKRGKCLNYNLL